MTIKKKLVHRIVGLTIMFGILLGASVFLVISTATPYKKISFKIKDFEYDSETATGYNMQGEEGLIYSVAPERRLEFDASDFFYDTLLNDKVEVWIKKSAPKNNKSITVYGVECNGKIYLELNSPKTNFWWIVVIISIFGVLTALVKGFQLSKVNKCQELWKRRGYIIALYDKLGNLTLIPCSTTSYLYPNVEMMDCYYEIPRGHLSDTLPDLLNQAWSNCHKKLANPTKLEGKLKKAYGIRSLKDYLQYKKILYIMWEEGEGFYFRKMKSVLPAPEQYVYEIVTEGRHLPSECSQKKFIQAIEEEIKWMYN